MVSQKIIIKNTFGLHLRPAASFCKESRLYESEIQLIYNGEKYNAKSVLSILGAKISYNSEIELICEGIDEEEALKNLVNLVDKELVFL